MTAQNPKRTGGKPKYDNRCTVSYPDALYKEARKHALKKGLSIQEFQRRAMEHYIDTLRSNDDGAEMHKQEWAK